MTAAVPAILVIAAANAAGPIYAGADAIAWTPNADGGHAPNVTAATIDNQPALRFTYTHHWPGWGNAAHLLAVTAIDWLTAPHKAAAKRPSLATLPTAKPARKTTIAIFADAGFAALKDATCAPADPAYLASLLERAGYGTAMLNAEHLADPAVLDPKRFPLLILPYGPNYPAAAEPAIRNYLMHGGGFFSTGGYVFDRPVYAGPGGGPIAAGSGRTITAAQLDRGDGFYSFNTRFGRPGDTMITRPDQIGAFDPAFLLERVEKLVPADDQFIVPAGFEWSLPVRGYAARSMIARNSPVFPDLYARTIPLIEARDAFGRPRGPVGSIAYIFDGPCRGSAWAFFGVTSHDLFASGSPRTAEMADLFLRTLDALLARRFLVDLSSDLACYHDERTVRLSARLANFGPGPLAAKVRFSLAPHDPQTIPVSLNSGETQTIEVAFDRPDPTSPAPATRHTGSSRRHAERSEASCVRSAHGPPGEASEQIAAGGKTSCRAARQPANETGLHEFAAELLVDNNVVDRLRSAFVLWRPDPRPTDAALSLKDNYFRRDGRATFLTGTNTTGEIFYALDEGPLTWDRDFADMADAGLRLVRILHFSPFAHRSHQGDSSHPVMLLARRPPERLIRQLDAIVQLARDHGVVIFLTLHDWLPVALTDDELDAQRTWNRFWVARYKGIPNLIYDIQNEPNAAPAHEPAVQKLWEGFLVARYGSLDAAWQA
ncbi:MAG: cellulase family glycosylhydrolase, partial [Phycisphaerae bacterium]